MTESIWRLQFSEIIPITFKTFPVTTAQFVEGPTPFSSGPHIFSKNDPVEDLVSIEEMLRSMEGPPPDKNMSIYISFLKECLRNFVDDIKYFGGDGILEEAEAWELIKEMEHCAQRKKYEGQAFLLNSTAEYIRCILLNKSTGILPEKDMWTAQPIMDFLDKHTLEIPTAPDK